MGTSAENMLHKHGPTFINKTAEYTNTTVNVDTTFKQTITVWRSMRQILWNNLQALVLREDFHRKGNKSIGWK